ncbi:MAG TPA: hypothetical protein VF796_28015 [Humisphaera sp.]
MRVTTWMRRAVLAAAVTATGGVAGAPHGVAVAADAPPGRADEKAKPVDPTRTFKGAVADEALAAKAPADHVVADAKAWDAIRDAWALPDGAKDVDFAKQVVLVGTTRGSVINGRPTLTDAGDLRVAFVSTRDLRPGFRYLALVVPRDGVKTVNGKPL